MRILQVIHSLRRGGAERVVVDLSRCLAAKGHAVRIVTISSGNDLEGELHGAVPLTPLTASAVPRLLPVFPLLVARLRREIRKFVPDLVQCHLRTDAALCHAATGTTTVRTVHTMIPVRPYSDFPPSFAPINWLERRSLRGRNVRLVACSDAAAAALRERLAAWGGGDVSVVRNGTDLSRLKACVPAGGGTVCNIAVVGSLDSLCKNQAMAVRALAALRGLGVDAKLWLLGDGAARGSLDALARQSSVAEHVQFCGEVKDVEAYLARATFFWMTSRYECFPLALLEAMGAGLPSVATKVGGMAEILAPWPEMLVPLDDHKAMARVTAELWASPERRRRLGTELRQRAIERYSAERMTEDYVRFYEKILGNERGK